MGREAGRVGVSPEQSSLQIDGSGPSSIVQDALVRLASTDPLELCNEAKIERCRATRDLRSCGRYVQHVLNSCGHASLCAECSQRCDMCPICRIPIPKRGNRFRLRLYYECVDAGLISIRSDDRSKDKNEGKYLAADIQHLYSLFDVAIEHNLVSLICHYITDVCMDESAVSSDPVLAMLLDEVVVKEWCKRTFGNILEGLHGIYNLESKEMKLKSAVLQKLLVHLNGIANVLEALDLSFRGTLSPQLQDLHHLLDNVSKAKQHLEVMAWCVRYQFLDNIQSCYPSIIQWRSAIRERKSAAIQRAWPDSTSQITGIQPGSTLFIEDALSNLGIEQDFVEETRIPFEVTCLKKDVSSRSLFRSKIEGMEGSYPFENMRSAVDTLFLQGSSDLLVAKQAILLYYLFDQHWTLPDAEWRPIVDDYAVTFSITRHSVLESLTFYLLDDHSDLALQEACRLLPEIAGPTAHPKIAQVLLERQNPDAALMFLRYSGHDNLYSYATLGHEATNLVSLREGVTSVRVRIECGLLTEAYMYQRAHCSRVKEHKLTETPASNVSLSLNQDGGYNDWLNQMEVLVTEICCLCIRRNLLDRMIELPWNHEEEKFLHKYLFDSALQDLSTPLGSFLVVFYLQRYRYIEAYQVHRKLQSLEQSIISRSTDGELVSKMQSMKEWRSGLVDKSIDLLPESQRQLVKSGNMPDLFLLPIKDVEPYVKAKMTAMQPPKHITLPVSASIASSLILSPDCTPFSSKGALASKTFAKTDELNTGFNFDWSDYRPPSILHGRSLASLRNPSFLNKFDTPAKNIPPIPGDKTDMLLTPITSRIQGSGLGARHSFSLKETPGGRNLGGFELTPQKDTEKSASRTMQSILETRFHGENANGSGNQVEDSSPMPSVEDDSMENGVLPRDNLANKMNGYDSIRSGTREPVLNFTGKRVPSDRSRLTVGPVEEANSIESIHGKRETSFGDTIMNSGLRWRLDETSDDEEEGHLNPAAERGRHSSVTPARGRRRSRFY
ncbi:hypothetical protein AMTRI_Chr06g198230 [Amborella trichopoda]|uniref:ELYS-like domain-containing protein n=1 Tax=Amborella trichopoda TaxID=13333 RepID=W1P2K5_AMBTC|nr:E3 ubiquitin-protein ligase HOS1 [Amborella trichopoda]ERN01816.1 hypothetical protein AMTR_s00089p00044750 [Amborella trichopoda]|eukprot:XP_006840141.1 E3 ubiquitin-protein ligase HOS1 [Amborella trichopoda]